MGIGNRPSCREQLAVSKVTPSTTKQPAAASSQEYLFEAPAPPMNQDDVLISMAERNR